MIGEAIDAERDERSIYARTTFDGRRGANTELKLLSCYLTLSDLIPWPFVTPFLLSEFPSILELTSHLDVAQLISLVEMPECLDNCRKEEKTL